MSTHPTSFGTSGLTGLGRINAAAYEAVNMLVSSAAPDCYELVGQQVVEFARMRRAHGGAS